MIVVVFIIVVIFVVIIVTIIIVLRDGELMGATDGDGVVAVVVTVSHTRPVAPAVHMVVVVALRRHDGEERGGGQEAGEERRLGSARHCWQPIASCYGWMDVGDACCIGSCKVFIY
jgi:hypothetical protein